MPSRNVLSADGHRVLRRVFDPDDDSWRRRAACKGMDPGLFFPAKGDVPREARAACASCPVTDDCLAYAMAGNIQHGVWGGTSERRRERMRRERRTA